MFCILLKYLPRIYTHASATLLQTTALYKLKTAIDLTAKYELCTCSCNSIQMRITLQTLQFVCLLVGCLTSQQQASVSQGRICSDNFTCCHTETEVADQTFYLTQSQYTDTGLTSPSTDPITPGAWQGSHWSANV